MTVLEQLPQKVALAIGPEPVHHFFEGGEYPDIAFALLQFHFRFIDVQPMSSEYFLPQLVVCRFVICCHKGLEHEQFRPEKTDAEKLLRHFRKRFQTDTVGAVLKHDPTFQAMEVFIQALMVVRRKRGPTLHALMDGGATHNHFAFPPAWRYHQIKGPLDAGFLRPHLFLDAADEVLTLAHRTACGHDHDVLGCSEGPIGALLVSRSALPQCFAGADIDSVPLIVEVGTLIDVLVIWVDEGNFAPHMEVRKPLHVCEDGDGRTGGLLERGAWQHWPG